MLDRLLRNNTIVKIIAAFLAILLWLTVHTATDTVVPSGGGITQISRQLHDKQVKVLYDQHDYTLTNDPKVTLTLHGSVIDVTNAVTFGDSIQVIADAMNLGEGTHEVSVYTQNVPSGVSVDAAKVTVTLEANTSREYSVKLATQGKTKDGYSLGTAQVNPKTVVVTGSKSVLESISQVVANVPLDGATDSIYTSVPIEALDKNGKPVKNVFLSHSEADVNIPVTKPSKSVSLRLQFKGDVAAGYAVAGVTQTNTVTVFGTNQSLAAIDSYQAPPIDLTGLTKTTKFTLPLTNVDGVTAVQPQQVDVEVQVVPAVTKTFTGLPIQVQGLKAGQTGQFVNPTNRVDVTVSGSSTLLDKLTLQDVSPFVDLSNQPAGQQNVNVQVSVPNFIKVASVTPATVTLNVSK